MPRMQRFLQERRGFPEKKICYLSFFVSRAESATILIRIQSSLSIRCSSGVPPALAIRRSARRRRQRTGGRRGASSSRRHSSATSTAGTPRGGTTENILILL